MTEHNQSKYYIDPYPTQNMDSYNNPYKFNGKEMDRETGMYYYGARYYDPRISIFISVDPLAEQTMEPYLYTGNNPIMFTDPTGMSKEGGEDWVYNKKDKTYHWDSKVNKPSDITNGNYEYVGKSTDDVSEHYKDNNPFKSYLFSPTIGEDLNAPWNGEISTRNTSVLDEWKSSDNIVSKITYSAVNDTYVATQALNPFQDRERITDITGAGVNQAEIVDSGVSTITSFAPIGRMTKSAKPLLKTMNASEFSRTFRGTVLTQTSHAKRGLYNRRINSAIRFINNRYGSFRDTYKSSLETYLPLIYEDFNNRN